MSEKLLITAKEALALLPFKARKLWSLTNARQIPHVRIGKKMVYYDPVDLRAWVDQQKIPIRAGALI